MDKSEQYIKMSDCPEIQGQFNPDEFNFLWDYTLRDSADAQYAYKELRRYDVIGFPYRYQHIWDTGDGYEWSALWLPRQDQLQEMLGKQAYDLVRPFYLWCFDNCLDTCNYSMEQLWLAFVMKENNNKTWDEDKWKEIE